MKNILDQLPRPFFVLAPMDDVTDTVFRQVIADLAPPDLYFTEFVNVDALQSSGRASALKRLRFTEQEQPLIAQLWGLTPENFYKSAQEIASMGFSGVDLNFGCPIKNVVQNGACAALMLPENRQRAQEIIQATREGAPSLPLSVKTRLGFNDTDLSWHEFLLEEKLNMLSIHARTRRDMSSVPARWEEIGRIRELRDRVSPATVMVGNGDVMSREQGEDLAQTYGLDGIMIGRGVFQDPFIFAPESPWSDYSRKKKLALYQRHVQLFVETWPDQQRKVHTLNKFCKVYINGFEGAKELREKLMAAESPGELLGILEAA